MRYIYGSAAVFAAAIALTTTQPVAAQEQSLKLEQEEQEVQEVQVQLPPTPPAEKLKKLKIMLMVSSLRCRRGPDDFQLAYQRFAARHLPTLRNAHMTMKAGLVAQHGETHGQRALDRAIVSMANEYGQGHPWLDCKELGQATAELADFGGDAELHAAVDHLLGTGPAAAIPSDLQRVQSRTVIARTIAMQTVQVPAPEGGTLVAVRR
ncbi:hypothetical protein [Pontixanthobacter sp. CEM42]|uniref:hypothetical protein n=1 Tax=Pontixanthobacter sp. CEM42 TaxID=2792077 RepID=UPI001ADECD32|nr:hypothetical protein [Pontixanthobacter sp. CEM42]